MEIRVNKLLQLYPYVQIVLSCVRHKLSWSGNFQLWLPHFVLHSCGNRHLKSSEKDQYRLKSCGEWIHVLLHCKRRRDFSGDISWLADIPKVVPRNPGHGTRNCKRRSSIISMSCSWCHEILVTAPEIARGVPLQVYMSISWFLSLFSSLLLNWPMVEIYSILCTSHCVVFYNVHPLTGQVLGKVLLTSWEIN